MRLLKNFIRDENGATALEYGMIAAAMALVLIGLWTSFGPAVGRLYEDVAGAL
jgi:pilus assembly protein Flp/PilA